MAKNPPEIRFTVNQTLYDYLERLTQHSVLGKTPNDVAQQILTRQIALMRNEDYEKIGKD